MESRMIKLRFAGLYILSILLIVIIFAAFIEKNNPSFFQKQDKAKKAPVSVEQVAEAGILQADDLMHIHLKNLQQLTEQYGFLSEEDYDYHKIIEAENSLEHVMDSIEEDNNLFRTGREKDRMNQTLTYFKQALQHHHSMSTARNNKGQDFGNTTAAPSSLNEAKEKDLRIAELEQQVQVLKDKNSHAAPAATNTVNAASNQKLQSEINQLRTKNASLTRANNVLQRNNEYLTLRLNSLQKLP